MATRKKHIRTPYEEKRKEHRAAASRHVLVLEAQIKENDKRKLFHIANDLRVYGNHLTNIAQKRLSQLFRTKAYREALKQYHSAKSALSSLDKGTQKYNEIKKKAKIAADALEKCQAEYKLTFEDLRHDMAEISKGSKIKAVFLLSEAENVWAAVQSVLYRDGKHLNYAKRGELPLIRAKQIERGITLSFDNGSAQCKMGVIDTFTKSRVSSNTAVNSTRLRRKTSNHLLLQRARIPLRKGWECVKLIVKKNDSFAKNELACIESFVSDPSIEEKAVAIFSETGIPQNTYRPCFVALKCVTIRGRLRVYAHITVEGDPVPKYTKSGDLKHPFGKGLVGVDLGPQSVAAVSDTSVILENLAERNSKSTKRHERRERLLLRALDRSRRANNKDRYNEDGTVKKGVCKPWKKSKQYRKKEACLKELRRKNALSRKYANNELANRIRAMGDDVTIEKSNVKALQKKAKPSTPEQGKKQKRRKRFGHSILHRCPGQLYAQLHSKFGDGHFHVVDNMYRASQYDHKSNTYNKKKLSQRWHSFDDSTKVQRDIYSAFLLLCHNDDFKTINQDICTSKFETFKKAHDKCVSDIKVRGHKVCNSGI